MDVRILEDLSVEKGKRDNADAQRRGGFAESSTERKRALVHFRAGRERAT